MLGLHTRTHTHTQHRLALCIRYLLLHDEKQFKVDEVKKRNLENSFNFNQSLILKLTYGNQYLLYVILQILFMLFVLTFSSVHEENMNLLI